MSDKTNFETILQQAIDELFVLKSQAKEEQRKFLVGNATIIKASYQQVNERTLAATLAEKLAHESQLPNNQTT